MTRDVKWMAGALAAALWIAPAGADDMKSGSANDPPRGTPTGSASGSDTTGRTTNPNTQSGMIQGNAQDSTSGTGVGGSATGSTATGSTTSSDTARGLPAGSATGSDTTGRTTDPNTQSGSAERTTHEAAGGASESSTGGTASSSPHAMGAAASGDMASTLTKMHVGNQAEIQAGEWMKEHATNDKVKGFAKKMVDDHSKLDQDVNKFAQKNGVDLASAGSSPEMQQHQAQLEQLKGQTGAQADREYMRMMVEDHQKDVSEVRAAYQKAKSSKEKDFASLLDKSAKKMEGHLKDAQKINRDLTQRQARTPPGQ